MTGYFVMNYELKFAILMNDPTSAALISGVAPWRPVNLSGDYQVEDDFEELNTWLVKDALVFM